MQAKGGEKHTLVAGSSEHSFVHHKILTGCQRDTDMWWCFSGDIEGKGSLASTGTAISSKCQCGSTPSPLVVPVYHSRIFLQNSLPLVMFAYLSGKCEPFVCSCIETLDVAVFKLTLQSSFNVKNNQQVRQLTT
jgi:hypothetical protein